MGPTQTEWHQVQQQLEQLQQQLIEVKQQATNQQQQQQEAMAVAVQQLQEQYSSIVTPLQVRLLPGSRGLEEGPCPGINAFW